MYIKHRYGTGIVRRSLRAGATGEREENIPLRKSMAAYSAAMIVK